MPEFAQHLDTLDSAVQAQLTDQTVTIRKNDPGTNLVDADTLKRTVELAPESVDVMTGPEQRVRREGSSQFVTRKTITFSASELSYTPTRKNTVHEAGGKNWKVVLINPRLEGRQYELLLERTA